MFPKTMSMTPDLDAKRATSVVVSTFYHFKCADPHSNHYRTKSDFATHSSLISDRDVCYQCHLSLNRINYLYEFYINGLKMAELGRNMLPQ
jgi:hypothetical protein